MKPAIEKSNNVESLLNEVTSAVDAAFFYTPSLYKNSKSYLFKNPTEIILANNDSEVKESLRQIDKFIKLGLAAYGFIMYEAGYTFENKLHAPDKSYSAPLLKFCFFEDKEVFVMDSKNLELRPWDENECRIDNFNLNVSYEKYAASIGKIKEYIEEGDTYQVNYTVKGHFDFDGSSASLFTKLLFNQSSAYSAFVNSDNNIVMSLSPELFFRVSKDKIEARPMKGTIIRGADIQRDTGQLSVLKSSLKDKAENLMIVDLLRNDLGRISRYGSVTADRLFEIEKYESLYQKVSSIHAVLKENIEFSEIIENLFPCGSVTGAPKIRTMQIINELETEPRGIYTGSIGMINKNESVFNVAIRTICINKLNGKGEIGIGSGIVWDSRPENEFNEVLLKGNFLTKPFPYFEIFETMLLKDGVITMLSDHIKRLKAAAEFFLFVFDEEYIMRQLIEESAKVPAGISSRLKLLLNKQGQISIEVKSKPPDLSNYSAVISEETISSSDVFRFFKTSQRELFDREYSFFSRKGYFDVLYMNENGQVCEGAISNIFIKKNNKWITPPVGCGLLAGVMRNHLIRQNPQIVEQPILLEDLKKAEMVVLTNSLRGVIKLNRLYLNSDSYVDYNPVSTNPDFRL